MIRYLEDLKIGEERISKPYCVSAAEIIDFAQKFDPQPFHVDEETAKQSPFGGLIASGTHTLALWRKLDDAINNDIAYICGLEYEKVRLTTALRPDDEIRVWSKILSVMRSKSGKARGTVLLDYKIFNQHDVIIATLTCLSLVKTSP